MNKSNRQFNSIYDKLEHVKYKCNENCNKVRTHNVLRMRECCINIPIRKIGSTAIYNGEQEYIKSLKKQCLDRDRERERVKKANL